MLLFSPHPSACFRPLARVPRLTSIWWVYCCSTSATSHSHCCLDPAKLPDAKAVYSAMEKAWIICCSTYPWAFAFHMVKKKHGGWRLCGDYCRLNTAMVTNCYHLPNITDFTSHFSDSIIFLSWIYRRSVTRCQSCRRTSRRWPSSPPSECLKFWWCRSVSGMLVILLCVHGRHPHL